MEASQYVEKIERTLRTDGFRAALRLAEEGLRKHLESPDLWRWRGDLLRLCRDFDEVVECYERAAALDPLNPASYERIAQYHDTHTEDFVLAELFYRKAIHLGGGWRSVAGLGRILAQSGREQEALSLIRGSRHREQTDVFRLSQEIAEGSWSPSSGRPR